jgi:hypothetical protein
VFTQLWHFFVPRVQNRCSTLSNFSVTFCTHEFFLFLVVFFFIEVMIFLVPRALKFCFFSWFKLYCSPVGIFYSQMLKLYSNSDLLLNY